MKKKIFVIIILLTTLILLGCVEMTRSEKNLCTKLASKSYAFIPNCTTETSCFEKVDLLFKTNLNYSDESYLYEIKNHVARSWYFYNESLLEQKQIVKYCNESDAISAAGKINQAQSLISDSFAELDQAMKKTFILIAKKESEFTKNEIDQIKEEKIYLDLIELRQILSELNSGATNSDTYVSYYSKKADSFAKSSASKGFEILIEKNPFWIEHFDSINNTILEELGLEKKAYFPFIQDTIPFLIYQAEKAFYKKQSLLALQNFPIYEFMKLYSDLGGNNNSAFKRFADLINRISENEKELNKKIEDLWITTNKKITKTNELIETENKIKTFSIISEKLTLKTINTNTDLKEIFENIKKEYIILREKKASSNLKKGEELNKLFSFDEDLSEILFQLEFNQKGFEEKLIEACKNEAEKKDFEKESYATKTDKLIEEIKYFSSRVKNTSGRECLLACTELIQKKELLISALNDYNLFESQKKEVAKDCLIFLEKIFQTENFYELKIMYEELKETQITKENIDDFASKCTSIQEKIKKQLNEENIYKKILEEYLKSKNNLEKLQKIYFYSNNSKILEQINSFEKNMDSFDEYFFEDALLFEKIVLIKETLLEKLELLNKDFSKNIMDETITYIEQNIQIKKINESIILLNEPNYSENILIIENPFEKINEEIYLKINYKINLFSTKDDCIDSIQNNLLKLNCLPKGKIIATFFEETLFYSTEKDSIKYASNELSLLKREIDIEPKIQTKKILVKTSPPKDVSLTSVLINSKETIFSNENNYTKFLIEDLKKDTTIEVNYYVKNGITVLKELVETKNTDLDETLIYKIQAKNNFSSKVNATIMISLPSTNAEIIIYSNNYTKKEFKKIEEKIILQNQVIEANEIQYYEIWVKTSNALDYYKEGLERQESFFNLRNLLEKENTTKKARESENLILMKKIFESNVEEIKLIELNEKEKTDLALMKQKLLEKIDELRKKQEELLAIGLVSQSEKIKTTLDTIINEKLDDEKSIAKAFDLLINLIYSSDNKIKSEVEKMWNDILKKTQNDEELSLIKNDFFESKLEFEEIFNLNASEANNVFLKLKEEYDLFIKKSKEVEKLKNNEQKELEKKFDYYIEYCKITLNYIEDHLITNNSELIKSKFIIPLTQTRIEKIRFLLNEICASDDLILNKLKKIEPLFDEVWLANENIKRQAINSFNTAIDNHSSKETLSQGKKLLDENNFIEAYLVLKDTNNQKFNLEGIGIFLPILIIIIAALVLKNNFSKKEKEESERKKIISEEWEKI